MRQKSIQENLTLGWRMAEREMATKNLARSETEEKLLTTTAAHRIEGKSLVLLQVNCSSIYNKSLDFWNLVDTYNADVVLSHGLERKFATPKWLGLILQLSVETGVPVVGECSFVLKITLPALSCG